MIIKIFIAICISFGLCEVIAMIDRDIVLAIMAHKESALEELKIKYGRLLYGVINKTLSSISYMMDIEECFNDVLFRDGDGDGCSRGIALLQNLERVEPMVGPAFGQKRFVIAFFHHLSVVQHDNPVGLADRGEAVGDD